MLRFVILVVMMAIPGIARATDPVVRFVATPQRAGWFVCDAVAGPIAAFVGRPDARGTAPITLVDRRTGRSTTEDYQVGANDPGAGQIRWSLSRGGRKVGAILGINPGMVAGSGADALPPLRHVTIGTLALDCRWLANMRLIGVGLGRSVVVTKEGGSLVYRSFDRVGLGPPIDTGEGVLTNRASSTIVGGVETADGDFRFEKGGFVILVRPQAVTGLAPASVFVTREGRWAGDTPLLGYALLPDDAAAPRLLSADLWQGADTRSCLSRSDAITLADCVTDRMRRTGATPEAIAFTRWLSRDAGSPGYVSGWRQAGPVGIATLTFPFRANTNETVALVPISGRPILLERWRPNAADRARPDWQAFARAHPDASPFPAGEVSAPKIVPGKAIVIRLRLPMRVCHACETLAYVTIAYRFDIDGRYLDDAVETVG